MSRERSGVLTAPEPAGPPAGLEPADDHSSNLERTRRQLRREAAEIERAELERAIDRLVAAGGLSAAEREEVRRMADRIVAGLVGSWDVRGNATDSEPTRVLRSLYDLD